VSDVSVIGAGAWGTAFAAHLARNGARVLLWVFEPELCEILRSQRENTFYLPGITLPAGVTFTTDLAVAVEANDDLIVATPSFALEPTLTPMGAALKGKRLLLLTKGLDTGNLSRMSEVAGTIAGDQAAVAVLSGPSFAAEVARAVFTSVVIASAERELARRFQALCHDERFRVYTTDDVLGVELGGALKNVMAIGAGIIEGLALGNNTLAAYVTRALAEMKRLGRAMGARETTFMGLSGMGDLVLTCTGPLSRNRMFGIELARGRKPEEIIHSQKTVVEGYYTTAAAHRLSQSRGVDMPITDELYRILYDGKGIRASMEEITRRDVKEEDE
jgi:glycerol-3-phosphate dehydrogenase (NAD(P)+)